MSDPFASVLKQAENEIKRRGVAPVEKWEPEFCGTMDMRIARDGTWFHLGSPIGRKQLVRLFSTVLRKDEDGKTYLVTPVEKIEITVDDVPFVAIEVMAEGEGRDQTLTFRTNVDDTTTADADHPIRIEIDPETMEPAPYVLVRGRLEARIHRPQFYQLVELAVEEEVDGETLLGVWSGGSFFPFGNADDIARAAAAA